MVVDVLSTEMRWVTGPGCSMKLQRGGECFKQMQWKRVEDRTCNLPFPLLAASQASSETCPPLCFAGIQRAILFLTYVPRFAFRVRHGVICLLVKGQR